MREHTAALQPPRALWVPFMLGRPLGAPDDAGFQKRVVLAALKLLEASEGPVLEDFPEDAPEAPVHEGDAEAAACPVSFPSTRKDATLGEQVAHEIGALQMWHELGVRKRGRSALGVTQTAPDALAAFIAARAGGEARAPFRDDLKPGEALRLACEELKTFYYEARMAQPGSHTAQGLRDWFWHETAAGKLLVALNAATENDADRSVRDFSRNSLVPRAVRHGH